jgi:hypothetical protein
MDSELISHTYTHLVMSPTDMFVMVALTPEPGQKEVTPCVSFISSLTLLFDE